MKIFWTGTDALMMHDTSKRIFRKKVYWYIVRLIIRSMDRWIVEGHFINSYLIGEDLRIFGLKKPVRYMLTPIKHQLDYPKKEHDGFNVLYYKPKSNDPKFRDWLYGTDLIKKLQEDIQGIRYVFVDGTQDMTKIYPVIDFYVRPNRHDGNSRMIRECEIQKIPYYWSEKNPDYEQMKNDLLTEYKKKNNDI